MEGSIGSAAKNTSTVEKLLKENNCVIVSTGTLKVEDVLSSVYDFLNKQGIENKKLIADIESVYNEKPTSHNVYYGKAGIKEDCIGESVLLLDIDVFEFMDSISPKGFYFGSHAADGACIGYFKSEQDSI